MVSPRIRAGSDRHERIPAVVVGHAAPGAREVRVERGVPGIPAVLVAPGGVGLPDLDEGVAQRPAGGVEDAPRDRDALADRVAGLLAGEVVVALVDALGPELR